MYHTFIKLGNVEEAKTFRMTLGQSVETSTERIMGSLARDNYVYDAVVKLSKEFPPLYEKLTPGGFKAAFPMAGFSRVCIIPAVIKTDNSHKVFALLIEEATEWWLKQDLSNGDYPRAILDSPSKLQFNSKPKFEKRTWGEIFQKLCDGHLPPSLGLHKDPSTWSFTVCCSTSKVLS